MATHAKILNEDCNLHYWSQGSGPLIILIPNGFGHGSQYNALMDLLAPTYTVATYDRRGSVGSPNPNPNKLLNHIQQARDVRSQILELLPLFQNFSESSTCHPCLQETAHLAFSQLPISTNLVVLTPGHTIGRRHNQSPRPLKSNNIWLLPRRRNRLPIRHGLPTDGRTADISRSSNTNPPPRPGMQCGYRSVSGNSSYVPYCWSRCYV